ncbi:hypothetical protein E8E14_001812 [Neopestalotiopsis sp. 37M]|nr:hypothetical protein E8E14_001812 [Neopestalotiopsis sp. 37M]
MASNNNNDSNPTSTNFFNAIKDTFAPHDQRQRRLSQSDHKPASSSSTHEPLRRVSSTGSSTSSTTSSSTTTDPNLHPHRDATGAGSQFLEDLTPGRQGRRRSSILEALGGRLGGSGDEKRRSSAGTATTGSQSNGTDTPSRGAKYFKYV